MKSPPQSMRATEWFLLLWLSVLWGGSFFFAKVAVHQWPPLMIVASRVVLAALVLNGVALASRSPAPATLTSPASWWPFVVTGLLNNLIPFSLIFWSQTRISSGLAAILNSTAPLFTIVLAHFMTRRERLTPPRLAGVLTGFVGVTTMVGADAMRGARSNLPAELAVLVAAVSYALAGIFGRRFSSLPPMLTASRQLTATAVMMVPLACLVNNPFRLPMPSPQTIWAILGLALLSTALAYVLYFRILAVAGATNLLLVAFLIPVSAVVLGVTILRERLEPHQLAGMSLIAMGLAIIDGRLTRMAFRVAASAASTRTVERQP